MLPKVGLSVNYIMDVLENDESESFTNNDVWDQDLDIRREKSNSAILSDLEVVLIVSACLFAIIVAVVFAIKNQLCGHCMLYPRQTKMTRSVITQRRIILHFDSDRRLEYRDSHANELPTYREALALEKYTNTMAV